MSRKMGLFIRKNTWIDNYRNG